jgi:hypothetical protein
VQFHIRLFEKGELHGNQEKFKQQIQFTQQKEFKLKKGIQWAQVQQEGGAGSAHGDASHAFREAFEKAPHQEPQAGDCDWAFEGAEERRQGSSEEVFLEEGSLI